MRRHSGSCLCAGVRFAVLGELPPAQVCHCGQCRKAQGTAFATNVPVRRDHFLLEQGADLLGSFESSPGKHRVFCRTCGSPVYSRRDALPDILRIRLGLLDAPAGVRFEACYFVGDKAAWWPMDGQVPQFEAGPESRRLA